MREIDDRTDAINGSNVRTKSMNKPTVEYRRIASTFSSQHSATTPWDLIQDNNVIPSPYSEGGLANDKRARSRFAKSKRPPIDPVPEDCLYDITDEDDTNSASNCDLMAGDIRTISNCQSDGSDFSLDSAWNDVQQLKTLSDGTADSHTEKCSVPIKPSNELRDLLLFHQVPSNVIRDVLTSLQLRDNWLAFLSKHFRRTLQTLTNEEENQNINQDHRYQLIKEVLAEFKPYCLSNTDSREQSPFIGPIRAELTTSQTPALKSDPPAHDDDNDVSVTTVNTAPPKTTTVKGFQREETPPVSKQPRTKKKERGPAVYTVASVLNCPLQHKTIPSCISIASRQLGLEPNENSGLRHFSASCKKRALLSHQA